MQKRTTLLVSDPFLMLLAISLVLALGEILDTPFRAMDEFDNFLEFDVFLDREVIWQLLPYAII